MALAAKTVRWAAAAALVSSGIQACSAPANAPPRHGLPHGTALVSINDQDTGKTYTVTCEQIRWLLTIATPEAAPGFTVLVEQGRVATAKFVKIRNLGGFTGSYWQGGVGDGEATRVDHMYSITGTAYGVRSDDSNRPATQTFKITTAC